MYRPSKAARILLPPNVENWRAQNDTRFGVIIQSFWLSTTNVEECLEQAKNAWLESEEGRNADEETRLEFAVNLSAAQYLIQFMRKAEARYPELFPIPETIQRG